MSVSPSVAETPAGTGEFVFTRDIVASPERVWRAWTEADRLMKWWGPKGFTMQVAKLDLRPGGVFLYCLRAPNGKETWGKFVYREVSPPTRLTFMVSFSNEQGGTTRHPLSAEWPLATLSTLTLEEGEGLTKLTIRAVPHNATAMEGEAFAAGQEGMRKGWTGTLDQLAEHLEG